MIMKPRLAPAVIGAALLVGGVTACGHDQQPTNNSSAPATAAPPSPSPSPTNVAPAKVDDAQMDAVRAYLAVRENAESVRYTNHTEWRRAMAKVTTPAGAKQTVERFRPAPTSNAQTVAKQGTYVVKISTTACGVNPDIANRPSRFGVECDLTDFVVTKSGSPVTNSELDNAWPYAGPQQQSALVLKKAGRSWLVDADYTGLGD